MPPDIDLRALWWAFGFVIVAVFCISVVATAIGPGGHDLARAVLTGLQ